MITLVTGGARSGKSKYAEELVKTLSSGGPVLYIATAENSDAEIAERIKLHRERRPESWPTLEAWKDFGPALENCKDYEKCPVILLDDVGNIINNFMYYEIEDWDKPSQEALARCEALAKEALTGLCDIAARDQKQLVIVTNEVGSGIVPENRITRAWRDASGRINCALADIAGSVIMTVCGIPMKIK